MKSTMSLTVATTPLGRLGLEYDRGATPREAEAEGEHRWGGPQKKRPIRMPSRPRADVAAEVQRSVPRAPPSRVFGSRRNVKGSRQPPTGAAGQVPIKSFQTRLPPARSVSMAQAAQNMAKLMDDDDDSEDYSHQPADQEEQGRNHDHYRDHRESVSVEGSEGGRPERAGAGAAASRGAPKRGRRSMIAAAVAKASQYERDLDGNKDLLWATTAVATGKKTTDMTTSMGADRGRETEGPGGHHDCGYHDIVADHGYRCPSPAAKREILRRLVEGELTYEGPRPPPPPPELLRECGVSAAFQPQRESERGSRGSVCRPTLAAAGGGGLRGDGTGGGGARKVTPMELTALSRLYSAYRRCDPQLCGGGRCAGRSSRNASAEVTATGIEEAIQWDAEFRSMFGLEQLVNRDQDHMITVEDLSAMQTRITSVPLRGADGGGGEEGGGGGRTAVVSRAGPCEAVRRCPKCDAGESATNAASWLRTKFKSAYSRWKTCEPCKHHQEVGGESSPVE
eukprot:GHVU01138693.1.p1 GENE.GHVU01138693.1~~GHVU01138693.1.p1  ORF type:complete len:509 (-),score=85.21 GHVU01138693.1:758-2284(-)